MRVFSVNQDRYHYLKVRFAGFVFHRINEYGRYLIMPLKSLEKSVEMLAIEEITEE